MSSGTTLSALVLPMIFLLCRVVVFIHPVLVVLTLKLNKSEEAEISWNLLWRAINFCTCVRSGRRLDVDEHIDLGKRALVMLYLYHQCSPSNLRLAQLSSCAQRVT